MVAHLPLEICRRIVEHLHPIYDNTTLAILTRVSRALQPIVEQHLYSSLYLVGSRSIHALLDTFTSRTTLASYPREMYIHSPERERMPHAYWSKLNELLECGGAHLELLCIVANDPEAPYASWILRSLRDAHSHLSVLRVPFWWDTEVASFLESDGGRGITHLDTGDTPGMAMGAQQIPSPVTLHRDAAMYLSTVEAPPAALCLLVPGRPVTHVRLRVGPSTTLQTLPPAGHLLGECLVHSTAPTGVIALDFGDLTHLHRGETYSLEMMELAPRFLPQLRFIGIVNFPWTKDAPVSRLYKPLIRLPYLQILELVVSHMHPAVDAYWELSTASELRTYSISLRELVFWKGYDRHRWVWLEEEADFVPAPLQDQYPPWGGL